MALSDLGCLRIRLLVIRHSLFLCWGGGGGAMGEGEKKSLLPSVSQRKRG